MQLWVAPALGFSNEPPQSGLRIAFGSERPYDIVAQRVDTTVGKPPALIVTLRPMFQSLGDLAFRFVTSGGGIEPTCEAGLRIPDERKLSVAGGADCDCP